MSIPLGPVQTPLPSPLATQKTPEKRLSGPWLVGARIGWSLILLPNLVLLALSLPAYFTQLSLVCAEEGVALCHVRKISPGNVLALEHWGIPFEAYHIYLFAISLLTSLAFLAVGSMIFWR